MILEAVTRHELESDISLEITQIQFQNYWNWKLYKSNQFIEKGSFKPETTRLFLDNMKKLSNQYGFSNLGIAESIPIFWSSLWNNKNGVESDKSKWTLLGFSKDKAWYLENKNSETFVYSSPLYFGNGTFLKAMPGSLTLKTNRENFYEISDLISYQKESQEIIDSLEIPLKQIQSPLLEWQQAYRHNHKPYFVFESHLSHGIIRLYSKLNSKGSCLLNTKWGDSNKIEELEANRLIQLVSSSSLAKLGLSISFPASGKF